jgi:hypothetical protein
LVKLSPIKMRFNVVSQSLVGIAPRYDTAITPAERAEPAAPECVVGKDAMDRAASHAPIITATAIELVTGIVSALCVTNDLRARVSQHLAHATGAFQRNQPQSTQHGDDSCRSVYPSAASGAHAA